jgi:hypothetical protein
MAARNFAVQGALCRKARLKRQKFLGYSFQKRTPSFIR